MSRISDAENKPLGKLAKELGKVKPFDLKEEEVFVSLLRTVDLLSSEFIDLFATHGLSSPLYNALRIVGGQQKITPRGVTVGTISRCMVCRQPDTTRLIDRLESLGYVHREPCTEDARRRLVRLTMKGSDVLVALHRPAREIHRRQFRKFSPEMLDQLNGLLQAIRDELKGENG